MRRGRPTLGRTAFAAGDLPSHVIDQSAFVELPQVALTLCVGSSMADNLITAGAQAVTYLRVILDATDATGQEETFHVGSNMRGGSPESLPRCLPRDGKRLSDDCPAHFAFTEDVGDILHRGTDPLEGAIVSGQGL
jgi:hypothetical protein